MIILPNNKNKFTSVYSNNDDNDEIFKTFNFTPTTFDYDKNEVDILFNEYNDTNNGIILTNSLLLNKILNKSGGGKGCFEHIFNKLKKNKSKKQLPEIAEVEGEGEKKIKTEKEEIENMEKEQVKREKLEQEIINFCNEYNKNAENILKNYIDNNNLNEIYKYPSLKRFIDENKKHYNIEYYISSFKITI